MLCWSSVTGSLGNVCVRVRTRVFQKLLPFFFPFLSTGSKSFKMTEEK